MSVLCFGEILVDRFDQHRHHGGAPANVACHVSALGEDAALVSRVGDDLDGQQLGRWLSERNVAADLLQIDTAVPTGIVHVSPGPNYEIADPAAWDFIELTDVNRSVARGARVAVFGTLAQRKPASRKSIRTLVETARSAGACAVCDLNLRAPFFDEETVLWSLRNCDLLKLNRGELENVSRLLHARGETPELFAGLLREFGIGLGVLTDGENGAWFLEHGEMRHQPAEKSDRFTDAVGAGDAFTAVLSVALSRRVPFRQAGHAAAALAACVVSQPGATPEIPRASLDQINAMLVS